MALKKCKDCSYKISTKAKICPNCGMPIKPKIGWVSITLMTLTAPILIIFFVGSFYEPDTTNYKGVSIDNKWDAISVCSTARMMIKNGNSYSETKINQLYHQPCTVSKVTATLPGKFAAYSPYSVSWPNGVAARVFVTAKGLRISGISENGIPSSWSN